MPGLIRKLVIIAAVDGLIVQPRLPRSQWQTAPTLEIKYHSHEILRSSSVQDVESINTSQNLEAYGLVGLLRVKSYAYLIAIAGRKHVANIFGKPIYLITDVSIIPLASQHEAENAIASYKRATKYDQSEDSQDTNAVSDLVDDADNAPLTSLEEIWLEEHVSNDKQRSRAGSSLQPGSASAQDSSVAHDVISRKGAYGRFAESWFSRRGWTAGQRRNLGMTSEEDLTSPKYPGHSRTASTASVDMSSIPSRRLNEAMSPADFHQEISPESNKEQPRKEWDNLNRDQGTTAALLPKLLQTLKLLLMSNTFYFSYEHDITRRVATLSSRGADIPLHRQCDPRYFWNANLTSPLARENLDEYVLPVMQGFIGQRAFAIENRFVSEPEVTEASDADPESVNKLSALSSKDNKTSFLLTLISRRSTKRAGFRYMRRGIDSSGHVANFVETEQILSSPSWTNENVHSFTQVRGSIPVFYSQTPYTFKPLPTLHGSENANQRSFATHFSRLSAEYGKVQAVSLLDKHGPELPIGRAYEEHVRLSNSNKDDNDKSLAFEWFDFHNVCRGMKFENVSLLVGTLNSFLTNHGWTTLDSEAERLRSSQSGIVRTNCMDCLDRTNVAQSAIAQHMLAKQLSSYLHETFQNDPNPSSEAFNSVWADNGDAISLTYAGTAALKGDYVRTRRRNLAGVLTDLSLTLSRYYRNLFDDFFAQAVLDFTLGNANESIFTEFRERMTTADPAIDLQTARETAIMSAGDVILDDAEDLLGGWVFSSPAAEGASYSIPAARVNSTSLRAQPFHEVVLLLTDAAIYYVSYDWDNEKLMGFQRVALQQLRRLHNGTYITDSLTPTQKDSAKNVGLLVEFETDGSEFSRKNTGTIGGSGGEPSLNGNPKPAENQVFAFKTLLKWDFSKSTEEGRSVEETTESELVRHVCNEISRAFERNMKNLSGRNNEAPTVPGKSTHRRDMIPDEKERMSVTAKSVTADPPADLHREERSIVSREEAEKGTPFLEHVEYGLKRLIWG